MLIVTMNSKYYERAFVSKVIAYLINDFFINSFDWKVVLVFVVIDETYLLKTSTFCNHSQIWVTVLTKGGSSSN